MGTKIFAFPVRGRRWCFSAIVPDVPTGKYSSVVTISQLWERLQSLPQLTDRVELMESFASNKVSIFALTSCHHLQFLQIHTPLLSDDHISSLKLLGTRAESCKSEVIETLQHCAGSAANFNFLLPAHEISIDVVLPVDKLAGKVYCRCGVSQVLDHIMLVLCEQSRCPPANYKCCCYCYFPPGIPKSWTCRSHCSLGLVSRSCVYLGFFMGAPSTDDSSYWVLCSSG